MRLRAATMGHRIEGVVAHHCSDLCHFFKLFQHFNVSATRDISERYKFDEEVGVVGPSLTRGGGIS